MPDPADVNMKKEDDDEEPEETKEEPVDETQALLLQLATLKFLYALDDALVPKADKAELKEKLLAHVAENNMTPYYDYLCESLGWMVDEALHKKMSQANTEAFEGFDAKEKDAKENLGETEIKDAKMARADYLAGIGEQAKAYEAYEDANEKTVGMGGRIDINFAMIRMGLAYQDMGKVKEEIEKAKVQVEKGGDWERRNLLCIYESASLLMARDFKSASKLLTDSVSTFTCYKLFDYNALVFYAVLTSLVTLDRVSLRDKVIKSPEILQVINEMPVLKSLLMSLFKCQYQEFFQSLAKITLDIKKDIYLAPHAGYYMREIRIVAYKQFLESYKSVTLDSMAEAFAVSTSFLDKELARFISAGRLSCKIDKVKGVVETIRSAQKEAQYNVTVKQGDILLNRIQKLSKRINC